MSQAELKDKTTSLNGESLETTYLPNIASVCPDQRNPSDRYAECIDQALVMESAYALAKEQDKAILLILGANWCPYCHALHRKLDGKYDRAKPYRIVPSYFSKAKKEREHQKNEREAKQFSQYLNSKFVVVYINGDHTSSNAVINDFGGNSEDIQGVPMVFALAADSNENKNCKELYLQSVSYGRISQILQDSLSALDKAAGTC